MKTATKLCAAVTASRSNPKLGSRAPTGEKFGPSGRSPSLRTGRSGLVEEAVVDPARAFLRRDLHVARREQEDLVRDALHAAVQRVGQPAREIDQALGQFLIRALEID